MHRSYASYTTDAARSKMNERLVANTILKNLSFPLSDSTEENWQDAFGAMEVMTIQYTIDQKQKSIMRLKVLKTEAFLFKDLYWKCLYIYPRAFAKVHLLADQTTDPKIFAMCAEYLLQT